MHLPFQYGKTRNFLGCDNYSSQPFVILGAPIDCATSFRSGTRLGPNAIRDASMMLTDGMHPLYSVELSNYVGDAGDMALPSGYNNAAIQEIHDSYLSFAGKNVLTLGGHHGITYPILKALSKSHGYDNLAVVQFDAHCDTWENHFGQPFGHGTWLFNAIEEGLINSNKVISIGIRSPVDPKTKSYLQKHGGRTVTSREALSHQPIVMADMIRNQIGATPCYISLDIDCLDPAYAPGTGTPEIAGLSTMWVSTLLDHLAGMNFVGMDCVEVSPPYDHSQITALAAATFGWQYLSFMVYRMQKINGPRC
jgi:agmatinase